MKGKSASEETEKLRDVEFDDRVVRKKKRHRVEWLDLPPELWLLIAKLVNIDNTSIEIRRFRSICKTWRSIIHLPHHTPFAPQVCIPLFHGKKHLLQKNPTTCSSKKGWIIMLGETESVPLRLLNPFTGSPVSYTSPRVLNLINFRVVELIETFTLNHCMVRKVLLFPSYFPVEDRMVCALCKGRKLAIRKIGDENWTIMDERIRYHDIILHKGELYVITNLGTIFWMDHSSLKLVQSPCSLNLIHFDTKRQMVEYCGSLHVVHMTIQESYREIAHVIVFIFKLDAVGKLWSPVTNLGNVVFVLGKDSNFSFSARDYYGCQGNCIYF